MPIKTVEEVRAYVQEDYWITGQSNGKSGYENFHIDWGWNDKLLSALKQAIDLSDKRILDLGCAYGQVVACMIREGYDAYGVDLSDFAIAQGQKEYPPLADKTSQGSIHELERYGDDTFDFLYSQQVFEHVPSHVCDKLAEETFRVAKPGAILWAGLVLDLGSDFQPQGFNPEDPDKTHINLRPESWWDEKFLKAGWVVDKEFDNKFRNHRLPNGYSFFDDFGWHSICYKKK